MKISIFGIMLFICCNAFSQNAKEYYEMLSKAEDQFISGDFNKALEYYDSTFVEFEFPFYRHLRQATIIASYSNDTMKYHKYLKKCIRRGMTINEFDFFRKKNPQDIQVHQIYNDFQQYRNEFLSSIDTFILFNYLELDMLENVSVDRKTEALFLEEMKVYAKRYMRLVDSLGYPTEDKTGLCYRVFPSKKTKPLKIANWKQHKMVYHKDISPEQGNLYGNIGLEEHTDKPISMKAGNWFLSHYHTSGYIIDTAFFRYLEKGVHTLKLDQTTIALFLEKTGLGEHEFLMTYYSPLYLSMKMKKHKIFSIDDSIKMKINKNRKRYYIRPIEKELEIIKIFYKLEHGKHLKEINKKTFKEISYQIDSFIKYM